MEIKHLQLKLKQKIDKELEKFFEKKLKEAEKIDKVYFEAVKNISDLTLRGGKRIRASLMQYGYMAAGRKKSKEVLKASLSMELFHSFALIHDDIIDNDDLRRGKITLHKKYEALATSAYYPDIELFGHSLAILCGDIAYNYAYEVFLGVKVEEKLKIKALKKFNAMSESTIVGEMLDVFGNLKKEVTSSDVLKIYKYKTAKYTFEGPLLIGCILGGGDSKLRRLLSDYSMNLGISFQISDDMIGLFGTEKQTGKAVGSDIKEGKKTLLVVSALERVNRKDKLLLNSVLGNQNLTKKDLARVQKIVKDCGAYDYCLKLASRYSSKAGKLILEADNLNKEVSQYLINLADYVVKRKA
ncbi:MAG: polyprenyl synthetase family protein [Candidatus Moranbacteria bacterium]|nr:polyprenyl synthetase family protein [Candidatus Moranbacteria bacterium]